MLKLFGPSLTIWLLVLTGCASFVPPRPETSTIQSGRVGLLVSMSTTGLRHTHVGFTPFNDFSKHYNTKWDYEALNYEIVKESLIQAGFEVVKISKNDLFLARNDNLLEVVNKEWALSEQYSQQVEAIKKNNNLQALVTLSDIQGQFLHHRSMGALGGINYYADGAGLFSVWGGFFGIAYYAVPGIKAQVVLFDPLYRLSDYKPLDQYESREKRIMSTTAFTKPLEIKAITEDEWKPLQTELETYSRELAKDIVSSLTTVSSK